MSQKKVDYYKQAKANRKREEKKKNLRKAFDYTILGQRLHLQSLSGLDGPLMICMNQSSQEQ